MGIIDKIAIAESVFLAAVPPSELIVVVDQLYVPAVSGF
jgi:hypothetical protein